MLHSLQLLLGLALFLVAAKLAGAAALRLGQPSVFGELLIGLVLGPTVLDVLSWPLFVAAPGPGTQAAPVALLQAITDLADLGVLMLMLVAGLETDLDRMRGVGRVALWSAAGGVALPMLGGIGLAWWFGMPVLWTGVFVGAILTATSVSISAEVLMELGVITSKEGSTILGAAVIDDVIGILILAVVVAFSRAPGAVSSVELLIIPTRIALFFAVAILVGRSFEPLLAWCDRLGVSQGLLAAVVAIGLAYAWSAEYVGAVAAITGAFVAGVCLGRTRFKARIGEGLHPLAYSLLVPVFFISIGLRANARALGPEAAFAALLIVVAIAGKILGCGGLARLCGFSPIESLRVGVGMVSRGEVGLIVAGYGLSAGVIGPDVFSASVLMVLVTTMATPPLLRLSYPRRVPSATNL